MIRTSLKRHYSVIVVLACIVCGMAGISKAQAASKAAANRQTDNVNTSDSVDLIRETQIGIREKDYAGLVWWIPFEFWEYAGAKQNLPPERVEETFKALRNYPVVAVLAAKVTPLGGFNFYSREQLQKKVVIRDSSGVEHVALDELSPEAQVLSSVLRPILSNAIGKAGENFALLFCPAMGKAGTAIADAHGGGRFSVVVRDLLGKSETIYEWKLPLTSRRATEILSRGKRTRECQLELLPVARSGLGRLHVDDRKIAHASILHLTAATANVVV